MNKSGTEGGEDHIVTFLQFAFIVPDGQRYRRRAGVTIVLDVDQHLLQRHFQALSYSLPDEEPPTGCYPCSDHYAQR